MESLLNLSCDEFKKILNVLHKDQIIKLLEDCDENMLKELLTNANICNNNSEVGIDDVCDYDMDGYKTLLNIINCEPMIDSIGNFDNLEEMILVVGCARGSVFSKSIDNYWGEEHFAFIPLEIPLYFVKESIIHNNKIHEKIKLVLNDDGFDENYGDKKPVKIGKNAYFIK